jgi:hypothetical protein
MKLHGTGPGVQHCKYGQLATDMFGIKGKLHKHFSRRLHQDCVEFLLIASHDVSQFLGKSEDNVEVADGKQFCFPCFQPPRCVAGVAFGTASVFAGMIRVLLMAASIAFVQMTTHAFGAAGEYVRECPFVAWQHRNTEFIQILSAVSGHDIGKFDHGDRLAIKS